MWLFDQSSCYAAITHDALDVTKMNVGPDGKQLKMHDTVLAEEVQKCDKILAFLRE